MAEIKQERTQRSLLFVIQDQLSAWREADLYHQIDRHRCDIHQRVDNHKVWQKRRAEFEEKPREKGER